MNTLKDYVNWKLTHADKVAEAEGYPLTMENCKANKRMKQLEVYGNSVQSPLSPEYQQLEYIEITETQYINTNYTPQGKLTVKGKINVPTPNKEIAIIGTESIGWELGFSTTTNRMFSFLADVNSSVAVVTTTSMWDTDFEFTAINDYDNSFRSLSVSIDNQYAEDTSADTSYRGNLTLFNYRGARKFKGRCYNIQIYDNDIIVRDFIPCYRISDNTIGMYDSVNSKFYTNVGTGEFIKGNIYLPTPENPIEVQSVGEKSINLFDINTYPLTLNKVIWGHNGLTGTSTGYAATQDYIPCADLVGKTITISRTGGSNPGIAFYDENKTYISGKNNASSTNTKITTTVPENAVYYRFCVVADYKDTAQIQEGNTVTPFEPYGKYKIPVVQRGINYHNYKKFNYKEQTINGITFTPLEDGSFHLKGKLEDTTKITSYRIIIWNAIPVKAGTYHSKRHSSTDITVMFGVYKKDTKFWLNINSSSNSGNATLSEDGYIGYCQIYVRANTTREIDDIVYPQLTLGTQDLPYEPYVEPVTTNIYLDEPLRKIGRDADYIDFKNKKVNRLLHEYYIDGSQTVTKYNDTICMVKGEVRCKHTYSTGLSNRFPNASYGETNKVPYIGMANAVGYNIQITNYNQLNGVTDNVSLKEWFKTHHTTYIKPLETPNEEPLNIELPKLNAKTTIIEVDTSILPRNAKGKYIKR